MHMLYTHFEEIAWSSMSSLSTFRSSLSAYSRPPRRRPKPHRLHPPPQRTWFRQQAYHQYYHAGIWLEPIPLPSIWPCTLAKAPPHMVGENLGEGMTSAHRESTTVDSQIDYIQLVSPPRSLLLTITCADLTHSFNRLSARHSCPLVKCTARPNEMPGMGHPCPQARRP